MFLLWNWIRVSEQHLRGLRPEHFVYTNKRKIIKKSYNSSIKSFKNWFFGSVLFPSKKEPWWPFPNNFVPHYVDLFWLFLVIWCTFFFIVAIFRKFLDSGNFSENCETKWNSFWNTSIYFNVPCTFNVKGLNKQQKRIQGGEGSFFSFSYSEIVICTVS